MKKDALEMKQPDFWKCHLRELMVIVEDMADHLPKEDPSKGEYM